MFSYPVDQLDKPDLYTLLLGSYWSEQYEGRDFLQSLFNSRAINERQTYSTATDAQNSISRQLVPVLQTRDWYNITLLKSEKIVSVDGRACAYPCPEELQSAPILANGIINPSIILVENIEFYIDKENSRIVFLDDPFFDYSFIPVPELDSEGNIIDYKLDLYINKAGFDKDYIYKHIGHVVDIKLASSQQYKLLINAILDAVTGGTSYFDIANIVGIVCDVPIIKNDNEIIEVITEDANNKLVITDKNVYKFNKNVNTIVELNQIMQAGDQLVDSVEIYNSLKKSPEALPSWLQSIIINNSYLLPAINGPLTFLNVDVPISVTTESSYTKLTWSIEGNASEVANFFDLLHQRGIAEDQTIAMLLDLRLQPQSTQPTAASLPSTINPAKFILDNMLRDGVIIVYTNSDSYGSNALNLNNLNILRKLLPPHLSIIFMHNPCTIEYVYEGSEILYVNGDPVFVEVC